MKGVTTYCRIASNSYQINGKTIHFDEQGGLEKLYQSMNIKYPKFHKMDKLAKAAFLGVEILLSNNSKLLTFQDDEVALLFANSESSDYSDLKFRKSYTEGTNPSPSQFVYTLPNILIGEIAIKNKWYGESLFFVTPEFEETEFLENSAALFQYETKACICGWVNVNQEIIDAFFFVVEKEELANEVDLQELYKK